jgi:hypothetical protein
MKKSVFLVLMICVTQSFACGGKHINPNNGNIYYDKCFKVDFSQNSNTEQLKKSKKIELKNI